MTLKVKYILLLSILALGFLPALAQEVQPRVAGLEDNQTYMSLLAEENALSKSKEELTKQLEALRTSYQLSQTKDASLVESILDLESKVFEARSKIGELESRIASIEQEYIISNLNSPSSSSASAQATTQTDNNYAHLSAESANFMYNQRFASQLDANDYNMLTQAQSRERSISNYIRIFLSNYEAKKQVASQYEKATALQEGDSLYKKYIMLTNLNLKIADSVETIWNNIYDQKSYTYSYIFDKMNRSDVLSTFEQANTNTQNKMAEIRGLYDSDILSIYPTQRRVIMDYELQVCNLLGLSAARDSVSRRQTNIDTLDLLLPKIILTQKDFIDYQDIVIGNNPYNASNPIPECTIYPRGVIYRIRVGTFIKEQLSSLFRKATPLYVHKTEDNRFSYFIGGYETLEQVEDAVERMKIVGFRRPEIVKWENGVIIDHLAEGKATSQDEENAVYRIEITYSENDLPEQIKSLFQQEDESLEISRIAISATEYTFIIGTFNNKEKIDGICEKITILHNDLTPIIKSL